MNSYIVDEDILCFSYTTVLFCFLCGYCTCSMESQGTIHTTVRVKPTFLICRNECLAGDSWVTSCQYVPHCHPLDTPCKICFVVMPKRCSQFPGDFIVLLPKIDTQRIIFSRFPLLFLTFYCESGTTWTSSNPHTVWHLIFRVISEGSNSFHFISKLARHNKGLGLYQFSKWKSNADSLPLKWSLKSKCLSVISLLLFV